MRRRKLLVAISGRCRTPHSYETMPMSEEKEIVCP
jgi:hypothetical protein